MRYITTALIATLISSYTINADIVDSSYKRLITQSAFTSNDLILQSGWYTTDGKNGDNPDLTNSNFVGSYHFGETGDKFRPFILGGFGFTDIEQNSINLNRSNGSIDNAEFDSYYLKAGFGLNYNPTTNWSFDIGASALWMNSDDGNYDTKNPLNMSDSRDRKIKELFDKESDTTVYDVFGTMIFHPKFGDYQSYFEANFHYLNFDYDHDVSSLDGFDVDLKAGVHTPAFADIYGLPIWSEFYLAGNLPDSDLSEWLGFDYAVSAGTSIHWQIGPMIPLFNGAFKNLDVSFNLQGTTSNSDFEGWKASVSCNLAKF